jgi:hypothetical protein
MNKSHVYRKAEVLAQQLVDHIDHPRVSGTIGYGDEGEHQVRVQIFSKDKFLSQGRTIVTVQHDTKQNQIMAITHDDFHTDVKHVIEEFGNSLQSQVLFYK